MKFTKQGRASAASEKAQRAIDEGHKILVWSAPIAEAEQIEAIEELGWRLDHMAAYFSTVGVNQAVIVYLFRR